MKDDFYKQIIQQAPIGYAYHRLICDESGEPNDFEYVDVNPAFAEYIGLTESELIGRHFSELFPDLIEEKKDWIDLYRETAMNDGQLLVERYSGILGGWCRIKAFSPEKYHIVTCILDNTLEKQQSEELENLAAAAEETEYKYKEEKESWESRIYEIADMLKQENERQFQRIIENLPFSLDIVTLDGKLLYANHKFMELFEVSEEAAGSLNMKDCWVDAAKRSQWLDGLETQGAVNDFEMHLKTVKGREFWAIASGILMQYQEQTCILSANFDITERKRIESELIISEEKYRLLTEFSSDVIWVLNINKKSFSYFSPSIYNLSGYTPEEAVTLTPEELLTAESLVIVRELIERDLPEFIQYPDSQKSRITEIRQKSKNGNVIWVEVSTRFRYNSSGEVEIVGASRNIEERKKAEREVVYLSYHDQLTGLFNRRFYEEELIRMNFKRNLPITLAVADVNGLKLTNDSFGHFAGDNLLRRFTSILNRELRIEDIAARLGGDEFVILLPKTGADEANRILSRIEDEINKDQSDQAILSVSIGWATKENVQEDFNSIFVQAENNMYHKKLIESTEMKNQTILLAMRKLYEKNPKEKRHSENVARICLEIGSAIGLRGSYLEELELLGEMHDIGKIGIPEEILQKKEKLTETDWIEIRRHPEIGYQILRSADEYVHIAESVLSHHEYVDGSGYPRNLKASEIPLAARILSVAEAYDYMMWKERNGKPVYETDVVMELMKRAGTQFDSEIIKIFIEKVLEKNMDSFLS